MKMTNVLLACLVMLFTMMPAMAAGTGEDNVKLITSEDSDSHIERVDSNNGEEDSLLVVNNSNGDGFNKLFMAPVNAVDTLMSISPVEKAVLIIVGLVIGGSFVLTIVSLGVNNGRVATGGILNRLKMITTGKDNMIWVLAAFAGFLFAIAIMKYMGSTSIF